jgi:hypothetical protein
MRGRTVLGDSPCDCCPSALLCRTRMLACQRFVFFQQCGAIDEQLPLEPSRELFQQMIKGD